MRIFLSAALLAVFALSGCASRQPSAGHPSSNGTKSAPVAIAKSNRFHMTQNGRQMSADDFDAWMKARGIRVAQGAPVAKRSPKPQTRQQAQAKPQPKVQAKAQTKAPPKRR